ncbi:MAG: MFS transporter [Planctomycetes bacterium]|nr:MFS transporter [Planctomycetota bacterium]
MIPSPSAQPPGPRLFRDYSRAVRSFSPNARAYLLASFLLGIGQGIYWVARNLYLRHCEWTDGEIGILLSATATGQFLSTIPLALRMGRMRLRGFIALGGVLFGLGYGLQMVTQDRAAILAAGAFAGVGFSAVGLATGPFLMRNSSPPERSYLFGVFQAVMMLASVLGSLIFGECARVWGDSSETYRWIHLGAASCCALGVLPILRVREEPPAEPPSVAAQFAVQDPRLLVKLCIPDLLIGSGAGLTIPFMSLYFDGRFRASGSDIAWFSVASHLVNTFAFLAAPILARGLGLVKAVVTTQLLSLPFFLTMALTGHLEVAVLAFLARNALMNMAQPNLSNFTMETVTREQQALTNSFKMTCWNLGWAIASPLGGWLIHTRSGAPPTWWLPDGYALVMHITIGVYVCGSLALYGFFGGGKATGPANDRRPGGVF